MSSGFYVKGQGLIDINMQPTTIFWIIIGILILNYLLEQFMSLLNAKSWKASLPNSLRTFYDEEKYLKAREYFIHRRSFSFLISTYNLIIMLLMFFFDGFLKIYELSISLNSNEIIQTIIFFVILGIGSDIINIPFSWYDRFVIEAKFGFNRSTKTTFILDKLKGYVLGIILGTVILSAFIVYYNWTGEWFWFWAWLTVSGFTLLMNMFYASWILPLFNDLDPMPEGEARTAIEAYCDKVGFKLDDLFVMDGSKRSTKANAFFSGIGKRKKIVLFDTLLKDYSKEELIAILAHEIGHFKKKHTLTNTILAIFHTGIMLYILGLMINHPAIAEAMGADSANFCLSLIAFGILYSPLSMLIGILMNIVSRKHEYEADRYSIETYPGKHLGDSLIKLSVQSLSNLTPHPWYVFLNYSHPTLLQRLDAMELIDKSK